MPTKLYELKNSGAKATISTFGAQVISWSVAGKDIFYSNPAKILDGIKPIRSGAPICFPWFNKGLNWNLGKELAPSHGPARTSFWKLSEPHSDNSISFSFETHSHIALPLSLKVTYSLQARSLRTEFEVKNTADQENRFELALHSYFATVKPESIKIYGLKEYQNKVFTPQIPIDKIFANTENLLNIDLSDAQFSIINSNFDSSVIWHPGLSHNIADLPKSSELLPFICIESLSELIYLAAFTRWESSLCYEIG